MVLQVIDKFNEYSSLQHQLSIKKVALMDSPNTSENFISKPAENSPFIKARESMTDSVKTFGTKRQQPDSPSSPSSHRPIVNKGVNGHIVYVRRKIDTERCKKNISNIVDSSSSSILSRKSENEETKDPEVQQDITRRCTGISHSNGLEPKDSAVTATIHSSDNPEKSNNRELNSPVHMLRPSIQDYKASTDPNRSSDHGPHAPIDPRGSSDQERKAPLDAQKLTNHGCKAPIDSQMSGYRLPDASIDPEKSSEEKFKGPVDAQKSTDQDFKGPIDSQRSSYQSPTTSIDPQMSSDQKCKSYINPQKLTDQDSENPVDAQRPINQDWKERNLKLQRFLKDCDQSSQEDYKRMLRSLTAVGRSKHALELEKRALHLLLEEGKELHRMQVLNVIGEVAPQDHAPPSTRTSASPSQSQRMETMNNPKSPFLRNGH